MDQTNKPKTARETEGVSAPERISLPKAPAEAVDLPPREEDPVAEPVEAPAEPASRLTSGTEDLTKSAAEDHSFQGNSTETEPKIKNENKTNSDFLGDSLIRADDAEQAKSEGTLEATPEAENEAEALRREIACLREELRKQRNAAERMERECEEFCELYPDVSLKALPDDVWESVRNGVPIAAAFALSERRKLRTKKIAESSNRENAMRSSGALEPPQNNYFSPDEVRAMSRAEVRKNYRNILSSMQKWC